MSTQPSIVEINCEEVRRELVNYTEGDLTPELKERIEQHLRHCRHCKAVYDGVKNVLTLLGDQTAFALPQGFSQRLYRKLVAHLDR